MRTKPSRPELVERNNQIVYRLIVNDKTFREAAEDEQLSITRVKRVTDQVLKRTINEDRIFYLTPKIAIQEYRSRLIEILKPVE